MKTDRHLYEPKARSVLTTSAQSDIAIDWWYLGPQAALHMNEPILNADLMSMGKSFASVLRI